MVMEIHQERGVALVLALFLMSAMSVLAASLMFLSQTETYASMNYRMMSQARYAAESGVQKAANFLLDSAQYQVPGSAADPLAAYDTNGSPVTYAGEPVVLSGVDAGKSNYPVAAVRTAFYNAAHGSLKAASTTMTYEAVATLISMQSFDSYGGGTAVVQTWRITASGALSGSQKATVEVVAIVERPKVPANSYAAFATDTTCGALNFGGNVVIDSYDSGAIDPSTGKPYTTPQTSASGGNVGTNGNLTIGGHVDVQGNLYTPRTGVGQCTDNAVDALTETGGADVSGSIVQLPANLVYPAPPEPSPAPPTTTPGPITAATGACAALGLTLGTNCGEDAATKTISLDGHGSTLVLPNVELTSDVSIVLKGSSPAAQYNFNSITLAGGSKVIAAPTAGDQAVLVNVSGKNPDGSTMDVPIKFTGNTNSGDVMFGTSTATCATGCTAYDASVMQIVYAGTGTINLRGNDGSALTVYAPNAKVEFTGTADLYGSVLAKQMSNQGNADIHYDRRLSRDFYVAGNPLASSFSWKRF
jgi:Tfp pilus assembly protein PilX